MNPNSLSSGERIKRKKDFDLIFSKGKVLYSKDHLLKVFYYFERDEQQPGIRIAVGISKKAGKAVWRNRVKRLLKEAYRLNKAVLLPFCIENKLSLKIVFSCGYLNQRKFKKLRYPDIVDSAIEVMVKIKSAMV